MIYSVTEIQLIFGAVAEYAKWSIIFSSVDT